MAAIILLGLLAFNGYVFYNQLIQANPQAPADPLTTLPTGDRLSGEALPPDPTNMALLIAGGAMLLFAFGLVLFYVMLNGRAKNRDRRRLADLTLIQEGLEQYWLDHGRYPYAEAQAAELSKGVLMTGAWETLSLPERSTMANYVAGWPLSDPGIAATESDQTGNYAYRPLMAGQAYELYAVLERPGESLLEVKDLPEALWGYTYRTSNGQRHQPTTPDASAIATQAQAELVQEEYAQSITGQGQTTEGPLDYSQFTLPGGGQAQQAAAEPPIQGSGPDSVIENNSEVIQPPAGLAYKPLTITMPYNPVVEKPAPEMTVAQPDPTPQPTSDSATSDIPDLFPLFPEESSS